MIALLSSKSFIAILFYIINLIEFHLYCKSYLWMVQICFKFIFIFTQLLTSIILLNIMIFENHLAYFEFTGINLTILFIYSDI